jgi:hypothetical protein
MGVVRRRRVSSDRVGHTLKGSSSPGEAEAGFLTIVGGSGGTKDRRGPAARRKVEAGSSNQYGDTSSVLILCRAGQPHERRSVRGDAARRLARVRYSEGALQKRKQPER